MRYCEFFKNFQNDKNISLKIYILAIVFSVIARLYLSTFGFNYDFESYKIVVKIVQGGGNVYAETSRYNYGPIWFNILNILNFFGEYFRIGLILTLSLADILISCILWGKGFKLSALLFLFSPITIFISGYHNQFDNLAVLLAMLSVLIFVERESEVRFT